MSKRVSCAVHASLDQFHCQVYQMVEKTASVAPTGTCFELLDIWSSDSTLETLLLGSMEPHQPTWIKHNYPNTGTRGQSTALTTVGVQSSGRALKSKLSRTPPHIVADKKGYWAPQAMAIGTGLSAATAQLAGAGIYSPELISNFFFATDSLDFLRLAVFFLTTPLTTALSTSLNASDIIASTGR